MLTIWGRRDSSNVQAVMWCIAELGLAYERHDVGHRYGGNDMPAFLAMNPNGLVPVVQDGEDAPLWESAAIVRYLASRYGNGPFWPDDLAARAQVDKWAEWAKHAVATLFIAPIFSPIVRIRPQERDDAAVEIAIHTLGKKLDIAEAQLARHDYLAGDALTVADIIFGTMLYRYFTIPIERPDQPRLRDYYEVLTRRPVYAEHVMVSYEALRAR